MGFHFVIAFLVAYLIAGNLLAAAMGTFFGNPLSFPFIWAATYSTGNFILNRTAGLGDKSPHETFSSMEMGNFWEHGISFIIDKLASIWSPIIKPMLVGSIPVGVSVSVIVYVITRWLAVKFRDSRQRRIAMKAAEIRAQKQQSAQPAAMHGNNAGIF